MPSIQFLTVATPFESMTDPLNGVGNPLHAILIRQTFSYEFFAYVFFCHPGMCP